jgi:hypothetical protein
MPKRVAKYKLCLTDIFVFLYNTRDAEREDDVLGTED